MNWLEFYKEQYYKEIERKDKLNEKFNSLLTIITIIGGGLFIILDKVSSIINSKEYYAISIIIPILFIIGTLLVLIFKYMYNVYYEKKYTYLNSLAKIEEKRKEYEEYYSTYYEEHFKSTEKTVEQLVEEKMTENIKENLIEATDKNSKTNNERIYNNVILNRLILTLGLIMSLLYIYIIFISNEETFKSFIIVINNMKEVL